jgi:site-specific DNA-methyltransferase (adenine-specific)
MRASRYQLLHPLRREEYESLKADIAQRGVLVPVEVDETETILDGHHRAAIADALGVSYPRIVRRFASEEAKREHVAKLNLARRHLDPIRWAEAFEVLLEARGIRRGQGARNDEITSATVAEVADEVGVPDRTARHRLALLDRLEELPADLQDKIWAGDLTLTEAERDVRHRERPGMTLPDGVYRVLYADPPWQYRDTRVGLSTDTQRVDRAESAAAQDYPTLSVSELGALDIAQIAHTDAVLFCWATFPLLPDALEVLELWKFTYKTAFVWWKPAGSFGHYHKADAELLLVATRGSCTPDLDTRDAQVFQAPREGHSVKPEAARVLIDRLYPYGPRIELFARRDPPPPWRAWGNE